VKECIADRITAIHTEYRITATEYRITARIQSNCYRIHELLPEYRVTATEYRITAYASSNSVNSNCMYLEIVRN